MKNVKTNYVFDSFALLAYLTAEAGKAEVQEILAQAQEGQLQVYLCWINLGEVLYIVERRRGLFQAQRVLALVESLPIQILEVTPDFVLAAAHIKAQYPLSYADAFVIATAQREKCVHLDRGSRI